jgi:hypothetical protein
MLKMAIMKLYQSIENQSQRINERKSKSVSYGENSVMALKWR